MKKWKIVGVVKSRSFNIVSISKHERNPEHNEKKGEIPEYVREKEIITGTNAPKSDVQYFVSFRCTTQ